jgi:hypothetical protein
MREFVWVHDDVWWEVVEVLYCVKYVNKFYIPIKKSVRLKP